MLAGRIPGRPGPIPIPPSPIVPPDRRLPAASMPRVRPSGCRSLLASPTPEYAAFRKLQVYEAAVAETLERELRARTDVRGS